MDAINLLTPFYLQDAMNSATTFTQTLTGELADSQRRFLALVAAGANQKATNLLATPLSNGLLGAEMVTSQSSFWELIFLQRSKSLQ